MPRRLIYLSSARRLMSDRELFTLLQLARANNKRQHITGLLLYVGGNFIQLLEGAPDEVGTLYARIEQDPRHHTCTPMLDQEAQQALFPDWSMAFRPSAELTDAEQKEIGDFLLATPKSAGAVDGRRALRLMEAFAGQMR